jgi:hypothetical protein
MENKLGFEFLRNEFIFEVQEHGKTIGFIPSDTNPICVGNTPESEYWIIHQDRRYYAIVIAKDNGSRINHTIIRLEHYGC